MEGQTNGAWLRVTANLLDRAATAAASAETAANSGAMSARSTSEIQSGSQCMRLGSRIPLEAGQAIKGALVPIHLLVNGIESNWRLPADTDVERLHGELLTAIAQRSVAEVRVEMNDDPRMTTILLVNGATVVTAAVVTTPEPTLPEAADQMA
jgi:hypothetical protein